MLVSKSHLIRPLLAVGMLASAVFGTAAPSATSLYAADLTVGVTSLPSSSLLSGASMIYTLTINNLATTQRVCEVIDPVPPKTVCTYEPTGTAASGVRRSTDPASRLFVSLYSVPDHGFSCSASGATVSCGGGFIDWGNSARIDVYVTAPTLPAGGANQTATTAATVNPSHAIPERNYTNNSGSLSLTVVAPPPLYPDLVVTSFHPPGFSFPPTARGRTRSVWPTRARCRQT